jgi:putative two-component system response regulator
MDAHRLPRFGVRATLALALVLYASIYALRASDPRVGDAEAILYVLPVGVLALSFGVRGGLGGALIGCVLVFVWALFGSHGGLGVLGYVDRGVAFVLLGLLVGIVVDRRRTLEGEVARDITEQRRAEQRISRSAERLREMVAERTYELDRARTETLQLLALAGEYRDDDTSDHTERVAAMAAELARRLGLDAQSVAHLREAALLHDVGKIAIPDHILLNPGILSAEEQEVMRTHAVLGARLLRGTGSPVLQMASVIAASHHEWWDGGGYPVGLAGERIPLVARIVAVADVFDALTHDRPYKPVWPVERAVARIERGAGSQFDPRVVAAFLEMPHRLARAAVPDVLSRHLTPSETPQRRWAETAELELPGLARPA